MQNVVAKRKWWVAAAALIAVVAIGVIAAPTPSRAKTPTAQAAPPLVPWTAVASTGAVDEDSLLRFSFTGPWFSYRFGDESLAPLTIRYNVASPSRFDPKPGWTELELTSHVPGAASFAEATLIRVDPCTGQQQEICTTVNNGSDAPICTTCDFPADVIDFATHLYYVRVILDRADQPDPPRAAAVRLR
jgi:hypothetical protein